jgi:hypothetical protein
MYFERIEEADCSGTERVDIGGQNPGIEYTGARTFEMIDFRVAFAKAVIHSRFTARLKSRALSKQTQEDFFRSPLGDRQDEGVAGSAAGAAQIA